MQASRKKTTMQVFAKTKFLSTLATYHNRPPCFEGVGSQGGGGAYQMSIDSRTCDADMQWTRGHATLPSRTYSDRRALNVIGYFH